MPWDLDDLEDDEEYAVMDAETREHLASLGDSAEFTPATTDFVAPAEGMTAIIFLNVDGVLHPRVSQDLFGDAQLNQLKRIVDASNARIVLSSPWRKDATSLKRLNYALAQKGLAMIGGTPDLSDLLGTVTEEGAMVTTDNIVSHEVAQWCGDYDTLVDPDKWIALDYLDVDLEDEDGIQHLVKTDESVGLTSEVADIAIKTLHGA